MRSMMRFVALLFVFSISFPALSQVSVDEALAAESRPDEDRARDAGRMPAQVLEFFGIGAGSREQTTGRPAPRTGLGPARADNRENPRPTWGWAARRAVGRADPETRRR